VKPIDPGYLIAPSILSADFSRLGEEVRAVLAAGADWIHVDVMDGHFVPNITIGPLVVEAARRAAPDAFLDVHLMIADPDRYAEGFARAGADLIAVHAEAVDHLHRSIAHVRELGCHAGVVLNPATPLSALDWALPDVQVVTLMSVNPGFGGQKFIPSAVAKVRALKETIDARGLGTAIEVDGGVGLSTIGEIARAGARIFVAGSAVYGTSDYAATIRALRERLPR
jgi:ribulose-phosphate 3-epimerase